MFSTINFFLLIFAFFFYKNAFCGELSFATEGLFCQVGVHILVYYIAIGYGILQISALM